MRVSRATRAIRALRNTNGTGPFKNSVMMDRAVLVLRVKHSRVWLDSIWVVPELRKLGYGKKALRALLKVCAREGVAVDLEVHPFDASPMNKARLVLWYVREGFVRVRSSNGRPRMRWNPPVTE